MSYDRAEKLLRLMGVKEQRADAVRDRVGDFLAQTVLTHRTRRANGCSVVFASHVGILA